MPLIKFQAGARGINAKPSYGGAVGYREQGVVVPGTPQTHKYLTYRIDQITGVESIVLDDSAVIERNLSPSICDIAAPNVVSGLSANENIRMLVRDDGGLKYFDYLNVTGDGTATVTLASESGSLARHIEDATVARLSSPAGDAVQSAWAAYSAAPSGLVTATPNGSGFVAGLNVAATSVWRTGQSSDSLPLMLISPRHAVTAKHVLPAVGASVTFRRPDGTLQTVVVDAVYGEPFCDLGLVHFNFNVTGIDPYALCPIGTLGKLHGNSTMPERVPSVVKAMHRPNGTWKSYWGVAFTAYVTPHASRSFEIVKLSVGASSYVHDNAPQVAEYGGSVGIGGDSGSPVFWLIGGQLCLVGVWSMTGGILQSLIGQEGALNSKMNELAASAGDAAAGTYAVSTIDLSGFTSYP